MTAAGVPELIRPTLNDGETHQQLKADRGTFEDYVLEAARTKGYGFVELQRLAIEHLLAVH